MIGPSHPVADLFAHPLPVRCLLCKETHDHVIRFAPPLVISDEDLERVVDAVREQMSTYVPAPEMFEPLERVKRIVGESSRAMNEGEEVTSDATCLRCDDALSGDRGNGSINGIAAALIPGYTRILNAVDGIEKYYIIVGVALVDPHEENIAVVTAKLFVCRLQI